MTLSPEGSSTTTRRSDLPTYVLTLKQPWAWAVIYAGKDVENRTWKPAKPCRLLIHAGVKWDEDGMLTLMRRGLWSAPRRDLTHLIGRPDNPYTAGRIIGSVIVPKWSDRSTSTWAVPGYWHWELSASTPARQAVPCTGRATFFHPPQGWEECF